MFLHAGQNCVCKDVSHLAEPEHLKRKAIVSFAIEVMTAGLGFMSRALFRRRRPERLAFAFAELYSKLWDYAEHSISHEGFQLPGAIGNGPVHNINRLLLELYGGKFASLSMNGSSGALITLLTAVLPKLQKDRDLILFDDMCHQSAIGGLIFGRWNAVRLKRSIDPVHKTARPLTFDCVKKTIQTHGANRIAAILIVTPCYDGFSSPSENRKIYALAKSLGITVIIDGAWDSVRFRRDNPTSCSLESICDIWITSPHKRGLTPSSLGCIITQCETIARLWDEAQDLGFRSSSISFVEIMIAEHRLQQVVNGDWNTAFSQAEQSAQRLRNHIPKIHPSLLIIEPKHVGAESSEPAHILIGTHKLPDLDARKWARILSSEFGLDAEKATASTLLLLCASPAHFHRIEEIKIILTKSFKIALSEIGVSNEK